MKRVFPLVSLLFICIITFAQSYTPKSGGDVVEHTYFTLAYSEQHEQALWVYYVLTPNMINGTAERKDDFRPDSKVTSESATASDYKGSGYDRGHLCPAASMTINSKAMSESFLFSNMSPQAPSFNRKGWQTLESMVRNFANEEGKIYVVTGPILSDPIGSIGANGVTVPSKYYKVVYAPNSQKMIAFVMPNEALQNPISSYAVSVDYVEKVTGIDFFHALPDEVENSLEANFSVELWSFKRFSRTVNTESSKYNSKSRAVQCKGIAKSTGSRCKSKTTNANGYCNQHQSQAE